MTDTTAAEALALAKDRWTQASADAAQAAANADAAAEADEAAAAAYFLALLRQGNLKENQ